MKLVMGYSSAGGSKRWSPAMCKSIKPEPTVDEHLVFRWWTYGALILTPHRSRAVRICDQPKIHANPYGLSTCRRPHSHPICRSRSTGAATSLWPEPRPCRPVIKASD